MPRVIWTVRAQPRNFRSREFPSTALQLRKASKPGCVRVSLYVGPERHCMKLWMWTLDCLGDPKILEMPEPWDTCMKSFRLDMESAQVRKVCGSQQSWKSWRYEEYFEIRHGGAEFGVYPAGSHSCFVLVFAHYVPSPSFGMGMCILCHFMLEACDLLFAFDFTEGYS